MTYNGWKNYETWNVALWINNTQELMDQVEDFNRAYPMHGSTYRDFVSFAQLTETGDGVNYMSPDLDYPRLDKFITETDC